MLLPAGALVTRQGSMDPIPLQSESLALQKKNKGEGETLESSNPYSVHAPAGCVLPLSLQTDLWAAFETLWL